MIAREPRTAGVSSLTPSSRRLSGADCSDRQAHVDREDDEGNGKTHADEERAIIDDTKLVASLLHEAAARARALRALPPSAELLERWCGARLVDVAAISAHPLARPVPLLLKDLLRCLLLPPKELHRRLSGDARRRWRKRWAGAQHQR